jgi:hypothetical protein
MHTRVSSVLVHRDGLQSQALGSLMAASSEPTRQQLQLMQAVAAATGQVPRPCTKGATAGSLGKSPYLSHITAGGSKKDAAPTALPWNGTRPRPLPPFLPPSLPPSPPVHTGLIRRSRCLCCCVCVDIRGFMCAFLCVWLSTDPKRAQKRRPLVDAPPFMLPRRSSGNSSAPTSAKERERRPSAGPSGTSAVAGTSPG